MPSPVAGGRWASLLLAMLATGTGASSVSAQETGLLFEETFQDAVVGDGGALVSPVGRFVVEGEGGLEITHPPRWQEGDLALRLPGGEQNATVLEVAPGAALGGTLEFICQRDGRKRPFELAVVLLDREGVETRYDLASQVNAKERRSQAIEVPPGLVQVRFLVTAPLTRGVWVDDVRFLPPTPMGLDSLAFRPWTRPLVDGEWAQVGEVVAHTSGSLAPLEIMGLTVEERPGGRSVPTSAPADESERGAAPPWTAAARLGDHDLKGGPLRLVPGWNRWPLWVRVDASGKAGRPFEWGRSCSFGVSAQFGDVEVAVELEAGELPTEARLASRIVPADHSIEAVSLVAAPDRPDRPEVLACAVSATVGGVVLYRSLDGGATWTSSDPSSLARDWSEGALVMDLMTDELHLVATSGADLVHTVSSDRGVTWSPARTLEGLGTKRTVTAGCSGIRVSTGELVVPVVVFGGFRLPDEPCAGILFSRDRGNRWELAPAAFPNTTTSSVVEVGPGALLLNMTDGRGALRSERTTRDFGVHWQKRSPLSPLEYHYSAGSDGAMVHLGRARGIGWDSRMVMANSSTQARPIRNMLLKGSSDNANHWPAEHRVLLDDGVGVDHPSLAPVGASDVGIAYRCSEGGVVFQRVPESVAVPKVASWFDVTGGR